MKLQGAIIAAGRGERLRDAVADLPKPLVELGGEPMLARQARAMLGVGASPIVAVINSETASLMSGRQATMPRELSIMVRDTANSMESLFALGEVLTPGMFLLATVDAVLPALELARFVEESRSKLAHPEDRSVAGMLAVTRWRGDRKPLFADVTNDGLISRLGGDETRVVTAGVYLLPTRIFALIEAARSANPPIQALRSFLGMLIEHGIPLGAIEVAGAIDVDEAADLDAARRAIREMGKSS
jgi:choline kinase